LRIGRSLHFVVQIAGLSARGDEAVRAIARDVVVFDQTIDMGQRRIPSIADFDGERLADGFGEPLQTLPETWVKLPTIAARCAPSLRARRQAG
jgi:hypothetical protein